MTHHQDDRQRHAGRVCKPPEVHPHCAQSDRIEFRIGINVGTSSRTTVACALEVLFRPLLFRLLARRALSFPDQRFKLFAFLAAQPHDIFFTKISLAAMIASLAGRWRRTRNQIG